MSVSRRAVVLVAALAGCSSGVGAAGSPVEDLASRPRRGAATATVLIQEASDLQCPYCSLVQPTLDKVLAAYPKDVALVWLDHPLPQHRSAIPAAEAAREVRDQAGDAAFWAFLARLLARPHAYSRAELQAHARAAGATDLARFNRALDEGWHRAAVVAEDRGVRAAAGFEIGAPAFFIGRLVVEGAEDFATFRTLIERQLGR